jgi:predicted alpha/beta-fold hydrolase
MADDGAMLNVDWLEPPTAKDDAPVLVVLPGITGHSMSGYLVHLVEGAYNRGWRVAVLVYPGTDLSKVKTARFIRGHVIHDLEFTLEHIRQYKPHSRIFAVGYSMGAALLTKYLAHHKENSLISAALSCSNPFDVLYAQKAISKGLIKKLYNIHFLAAIKKMYRINEQVFREAFPHITAEDVAKISSVEEYDTRLTMKHFGFDDLTEYYVSLGCQDSVQDVAVPMLVAHAKDDPIVPPEAIPMEALEANPNIITMVTGMGGHTGWLQGLNPMGPSWFDDVALEWLVATNQYLIDNPRASHHRVSTRSKRNGQPPIVTQRVAAKSHIPIEALAGASSKAASGSSSRAKSIANADNVDTSAPKSPKSPGTKKRAPRPSMVPSSTKSNGIAANKSPKGRRNSALN